MSHRMFCSSPTLVAALVFAQGILWGCYNSPDSASEPCLKDTDCKGDRLCIDGYCQSPGTTGGNIPTDPTTEPTTGVDPTTGGGGSNGDIPPEDSDEEEPGEEEEDKLPDACIDGAPAYMSSASDDFCPLPVVVLVDQSDGPAMTDEEVEQEFVHVNNYFAKSYLSFKVIEILPFETMEEFEDALATDHVTVGFFHALVTSDGDDVCGLATRGTNTKMPRARVDIHCTSVHGVIDKNTTVHELGHVLGLRHPHGTGGPKGDAPVEPLDSECYATEPYVGDYLCDTPPDPSDQYCSDDCDPQCDAPYDAHNPDPKLAMSYYPDKCQSPDTAFSSEQINTMRCLVDTWYAGLGMCCSPNDHMECSGGDVYWVDSCGSLGSVAEQCSADTMCVEVSATSAECQAIPEDCGNEVIDPGEDCDDMNLNGATCGSEGLGSGILACNAVCLFDTSGCCNENASYDCYQGDVYWFDSCGQPGDVKESCSDGCSGGECVCEESYAVSNYECPDFTSANGLGPGGGELMAVCGTIDQQSGFMTIRAEKQPNDPNPVFGQRPYQVRVSGASDDPCGPDTYFFNVSDDSPSGVGSDELVFQFQSSWTPGQTEKAYCVTASTKSGDVGYDSSSSQQESWWWSDKVVVTRDECP
jgi:hypothetical protein